MTAIEETTKEVVQRYTDDGYNEQNVDVISDCVSPDITVHGLPYADGTVTGLDDYLEWGAMMFEAFPDAHLQTEEIISEGNKVAIRWTLTATHDGLLGDIPRTGESIEVDALAICRLENGQIAEKWFRLDEVGLLSQIGVME